VAQSIGGGGGQAGSNDGSTLFLRLGGSSGGSGRGGAVTVNHTGSIFALGTNSRGIFAQSIGPDGNGNIAVTVNGGMVIGGPGTGSGILLDGGSTNRITIGSGGSVSALSGTAIVSNGGAGIANTVDNSGTVTGSVRLGGGAGAANAFNNLAGGTFNAGTSVDLGGNGFLLTNNGLVEISGRGIVGTTALTGGFTQTAGGTMGLDVRFGGGASDRLTVGGNASVGGTVRPNNLFLMPTQTAVTVLTAGGALANAGASVVSTPTITYGLDFNGIGGPGAMVLTIDGVNFGGLAGLTGNQRALGNYFQGLYGAGGAPQLGQLMGYLSNLNAGDYASALDRLTPASYAATANSSVTTGLNFANALLSCHGFEGTYAAIREHQCAWVRVGGSAATQAASSTNPGWHEEGVRVQAGGQYQMKPDWFLGLGMGYERASAGVGVATSVATSRYDLGAILKYAPGPWLLAGALEAGYANADTTRSIGFPAPNTTAYGNSGTWHVDGKLRAAYLFELGNFYAKPMAGCRPDLALPAGLPETGAGPLSRQLQQHELMAVSRRRRRSSSRITAIDGGDPCCGRAPDRRDLLLAQRVQRRRQPRRRAAGQARPSPPPRPSPAPCSKRRAASTSSRSAMRPRGLDIRLQT
jgi:hypothetical protein